MYNKLSFILFIFMAFAIKELLITYEYILVLIIKLFIFFTNWPLNQIPAGKFRFTHYSFFMVVKTAYVIGTKCIET